MVGPEKVLQINRMVCHYLEHVRQTIVMQEGISQQAFRLQHTTNV
jgi:hypothetical protein